MTGESFLIPSPSHWLSKGGANLATKEYFLPQSLDEATRLLAEHGSLLLVMAGGTIVMPLINEGASMPEMVMGLRQAAIDEVKALNGTVTIGAGATITRMTKLEQIPLLQTAARHVGGWQIRNVATVAGNLFAPPPAGDFATALLALDATVHLVSTKGERTVPLADFYTGFLSTDLQPGELVSQIDVPVPNGKTSYIKLGRKKENTPAIVTVAACIEMAGGKVEAARIALNGAGDHPMRAKMAEAALIGKALDKKNIAAAAAAAKEECEPFTDAIASEWYRRRMVEVFVKRALAEMA
jgi:CO/xanthine dehydrogenase FAD-binding subunit